MKLGILNFFIILLIFTPIFFGYDLQNGSFVTDVNILVSERILSFPSFPLGIGIVLLGFLFTLREANLIQFITLNLFFGLLSILIFFYTENIRHFAYNISILVGSSAYYLGKYYALKFDKESLLYSLGVILNLLIYSKLAADIFFYDSFFSDYFLLEGFVIYNLYDYFPIIYLITAAISILLLKVNFYLSFISFLGSFIVLFTFSRFYIFAVFLLYFLSIIRIHKVKPFQSLTLSILFVIILTGIFPFFAEIFNPDPSLSLRVFHWQNFFVSTDIVGLFFPFINDYRSGINTGTFHNEFLDPYSYFGIFYFALIVIVVIKINNLEINTRIALIPFFIVLIFGMLIQNNFSQPYNALLVFFLLGIFSEQNTIYSQKSSTNFQKNVV